MRILIAPDKFKGSLTAIEVAESIKQACAVNGTSHEVDVLPLADGGEGTAEILAYATGGSMSEDHKVLNPLMRSIMANYGLSQDKKTAFIEMAKASGLNLLMPEDYDVLHSSTYGTGQLIHQAMEAGVKNIILCIGGSATNDAGIGMASALGYIFKNEEGTILMPIGKNLPHIHSIESNDINPKLKKVKFTVACDVTNPFFGSQGAAHVYARQKGADDAAIKYLDEGLHHIHSIIKAKFNINLQLMPGSGAAGGMGGGAITFLKAKLRSGFDIVSEAIQLEEKIKNADLIITGEGKIDIQTANGKLVNGVASLCKKHLKPCIAFCGISTLSEEKATAMGLDTVVQASPEGMPVMEAMLHAKENLLKAATAYFKDNAII
jgi:glycerate 2-kinase